MPSKVDSECEKVMRKFCKDVPKKEEVMKEVDICVNNPKEVHSHINQRCIFTIYPIMICLDF